MNATKIISGTMVSAAALLGFSILLGSWYTVSEGYRGVITRNNAVIGLAQPGLGFKLPFFDGVTDMTIQTTRTDFEGVVTYSKDIQTSTSAIVINSRLQPDAVLSIYTNVGADYASKLVWPALYKRYKETLGLYTAADIIQKRQEIGEVVTAKLAADMLPHGIIIEGVQLTNIDFSDAYETAAENAATAQAKVRQAQQELEQVRVSALKQVAEAEAAATAIKATADAQAYATEAKGKAEASAIAARGKALRDNPDLVTLIAAEKWDGKLPVSMVPGSAIPFVSLPQLGGGTK